MRQLGGGTWTFQPCMYMQGWLGAGIACQVDGEELYRAGLRMMQPETIEGVVSNVAF